MVNVIWQTINEERSIILNTTLSQFEYIEDVLFKYLPHKNIFDNERNKTFINNSIIIYSSMGEETHNGFREYLNKYDELGYNYILFHISNENLHHDLNYYKNAKHVFRFYYDDNIKLDNVTTLPLGFVTGFLNRKNEIKPTKERYIIASFLGELKQDRIFLVDELYKNNNAFIRLTNRWGDPNAYSVKDVIEIYKRTKFVPCSIGNYHVETLRLYEALEWGCIPIIKKYYNEDYYKKIFGEHPLPVIDDWGELNDLMKKLDNDNLDNYMLVINDWYKEFMDNVAKNVSEISLKKLQGKIQKRRIELDDWIKYNTYGSQSVVELGAGFFNRLGYVNEYTTTKIGIEIHKPYIDNAIYDNCIKIHGDALKYMDYLQDYQLDTVMIIDVLEHFYKDDALKLIENLKKDFNKIILMLPVGEFEQHSDLYNMGGGEYQTHRSTWMIKDILDLNFDENIIDSTFHKTEYRVINNLDTACYFGVWYKK